MDDRRQRPRPEPLTGPAPGPLQRQVLRVLHGARLMGIDSMSAHQIAAVLTDCRVNPVTQACGPETYQASVDAAVSGMINFRHRNWVEETPFGAHEGTCLVRSLKITEKGLAWI